MRIGLLNNLRAGRSDAQVNRLLRFLRDHPNVVHVETGSAGAVPDALAELARQQVDLLAVNGGDGTLQRALTEILGDGVFEDRIPMIAPLRGGRTNMSALDLGTQSDPVKGMQRLIQAAEDGTLEQRIVPRRVLRVEYGRRHEVAYGMFFGGGIIYRAIELTHRLFPKDRSLIAGSTLVTAGLLSRLALGSTQGILVPEKILALFDGEPVPWGEFHLMISTTLGRLFAGMRPFWGGEGGSVRITSIATGSRRFARAAPGILRGKPLPFVTPENGYLSRNVKCAQLRLDCGFTVDGELFAPESDRVIEITADDRVRFVRA